MATTAAVFAVDAPPNLMLAAAAEVAANVSGVLSAPNLDPALLFLALVLLASRNGY